MEFKQWPQLLDNAQLVQLENFALEVLNSLYHVLKELIVLETLQFLLYVLLEITKI